MPRTKTSSRFGPHAVTAGSPAMVPASWVQADQPLGVQPLALEPVVGAAHEDVEPVRGPRRHGGITRGRATQRVPGRPAASVPLLALDLAVGGARQHVESIRRPRLRGGVPDHGPAQPLPGRPGEGVAHRRGEEAARIATQRWGTAARVGVVGQPVPAAGVGEHRPTAGTRDRSVGGQDRPGQRPACTVPLATGRRRTPWRTMAFR